MISSAQIASPIASCLRLIGTFLVLLLSIGSSLAQVNLELTSSAPATAIPTGEIYSVKFQYRCASTLNPANNARLEVPLPTHINFEGVNNSPHIANSGYNSGTNTVWFDFVDPLNAGTTGEVAIRVAYENGPTPNGTSASFVGSFTADNASTVAATATTTAYAISRLSIEKYLQGEAGLGSTSVYSFRIGNGPSSTPENGTLNLQNVSFEDVLPAGATFVQFDSSAGGFKSKSYDPVTRTAKWELFDLAPGEREYARIVLQYDSPANFISETITNTAIATATPVGETTVSVSDSETHNILASFFEIDVDKDYTGSAIYPSGYSSYNIDLDNDGTETLNDLTLTDVLPSEIEVYRIELGASADAAATDHAFVTFKYKTNLNPSWQTYALSPMESWDDETVELSDLGLAMGGAEYLTELRWEFGDRSSAFRTYNDIEIDFQVRSSAPAGVITNCVDVTSSSPGATTTSACDDFTLSAPIVGPVLYMGSKLDNGFSNPFGVGERVRIESYFHNLAFSTEAMEDFVGILHFPQGTSYVPGSMSVNRKDGFSDDPDLEYIEDFDGNGNNILKVYWTGAVKDLAIDAVFDFDYEAEINNLAPAGIGALDFRMIASSSNALAGCYNGSVVDVDDLDGDSDTSEELCERSLLVDISDYVALSSELSVKGSLDTEYFTFPDEGETLPGGLADYRLTVVNEGNVNLSDFTFLDIFPQVGDVGIIDPQARNSVWRPNLVGPVAAPSGVVVYYSTASNPCRAADGFLASDPPGCQVPNWTIVPPADIATVNSIKVEFGNVLIAPNDTLVFDWPMRTPTDVLSQPGVNTGDLAFNSVGFIATVDGSTTPLLPSEPVKTGLAIKSLVPGVLGDRVWSDTNGDGIQDFGETGINNVRVELYEDDGDGIANVDNDSYLGFTVTAGDGNYLFPNLNTGDYFVFFVKPLTFSLVPAQQGADPALDSDGTSYTANGQLGAISDVTSITNTDFEFTVDLGLEPTGLGAIGDYVWNDINANGIQDEGVAAGVTGVVVNLLNSGGAVLASTTTKPDEFGNPGYFFFDGISPGSYRLSIDIPSGTTLSAMAQGGSADADSDGDPGNSGQTGLISVTANTFTGNIDFALQLSGVEVCGNGIDDDGDGLSDCEDPDCEVLLIVSQTISACIDQPLRDVATLEVEVSWPVRNPVDTLEVNVNDKTEYIFINGGVTSPQVVSFIVPADGSTGNSISVNWRSGFACPASDTYTAPVACSTDTLACNILYLCGEEKPQDGDGWDHGWVEYLQEVNGANSLMPVITRDEAGMGTYDAMNPATPVTIDVDDYDLIIISTTTEGHVSADMITALQTTPSSILLSNYLIADDLGFGNSSYTFDVGVHVDNSTKEEIYNFDNINANYSNVFTHVNYHANADAYLWMNAGDMASDLRGVSLYYEPSDVLPGISSHGPRAYLGYHMNGVYGNAQNGGIVPVPAAYWFSPEKHLTLKGKEYFDQALVDISRGCLIEDCTDGVDNDGDGLVDCLDNDCPGANAVLRITQN